MHMKKGHRRYDLHKVGDKVFIAIVQRIRSGESYATGEAYRYGITPQQVSRVVRDVRRPYILKEVLRLEKEKENNS